VCIAAERTDSRDKWLYHKTTRRAVYAEAYTRASGNGFDDVLFLNEREELTEGAISNVFVEKEGRIFTPPVDCGVLAGVYRRYMLQTRPDIEERVLMLDDLRRSDAVYICNAVRGLRKAQIFPIP
jgi:para-aminobenzoate synthetase/4-amino-4-deoxychorismate lyase